MATSATTKVTVIRSEATKSGNFVSVLNHRQDTPVEDPILGTVIKTKSDYYYVKTAKQLPVESELELDMSRYDIEESEYKNNNQDSVYYGETQKAKWLMPKA